MPCQDEGQSQLERNRHQDVTDMLCTLCQRLEAGGYGVLLSGRVLEWWQAHQAADVRRQNAHINSVFHHLWTKAVHQEGYVKVEWEEFARVLGTRGIAL